MRWLWTGIVLTFVAGGCGHDGGDPSGAMGGPAVATSSEASGPPWHSVAGGVPQIPGAVLVTTGPTAVGNGFDDESHFHRLWPYTGRVLSVTVDIDRTDPDIDGRAAWQEHERSSRSTPHLVASLAIEDGGYAVLDQKQKGAEGPVVRAYAFSGNAYATLLMRVDGVIATEADLTARSAELIGALSDVLDDLRPEA